MWSIIEGVTHDSMIEDSKSTPEKNENLKGDLNLKKIPYTLMEEFPFNHSLKWIKMDKFPLKIITKKIAMPNCNTSSYNREYFNIVK